MEAKLPEVSALGGLTKSPLSNCDFEVRAMYYSLQAKVKRKGAEKCHSIGLSKGIEMYKR